ncbi:hypothetical protein MCOR07_011283 [Pyricularia oryzae]|nr:hypothetical protein MCOR21_004318 [Pyricularia oryzae]KAI6574587.1 hypothetical protein MCOR06_011401 [Pyricularia oryzae]KAI6588192.1 hypothetical protein MCOR04_004213 [Pyricularia oryzae]KAI6609706.1 hypothetical protein MCOR07_011283 [Pyricularia oryzae]KAI6636754.1 hypothetical protein MCOR14_005098 [Pyricularia oryzae]
MHSSRRTMEETTYLMIILRGKFGGKETGPKKSARFPLSNPSLHTQIASNSSHVRRTTTRDSSSPTEAVERGLNYTDGEQTTPKTWSIFPITYLSRPCAL